MYRMFGILLVGLGCVAAHAQDAAVSGDEIKATWVGKKIFARSSTGGLVDFTMAADGTASVAVGNFTDTGTWRPQDKGYCAKWNKIRGGQESCFNVVRRGGDLYVLNPDGSTNTQILKIQ
jgi:hypothetical protein